MKNKISSPKLFSQLLNYIIVCNTYYIQPYIIVKTLKKNLVWKQNSFSSLRQSFSRKGVLFAKRTPFRYLVTALQGWPLKLVQHIADATCVPPSPAGPPSSCPLHLLYLLNLRIRILIGTTADKNPYRHDRNIRFSYKLNNALFCIFMASFI